MNSRQRPGNGPRSDGSRFPVLCALAIVVVALSTVGYAYWLDTRDAGAAAYLQRIEVSK